MKNRNLVISKLSGYAVLKAQHNTHIPEISCEYYGHNTQVSLAGVYFLLMEIDFPVQSGAFRIQGLEQKSQSW